MVLSDNLSKKEVEKRFLLKFVGTIVDIDGIVIFVESLVHSFN